MSEKLHWKPLLAAAVTGLALAASAAPAAAAPASGRTLAANTQFYVRHPDQLAQQQLADLRSAGDKADANKISQILNTAQAVWLDGGTPKTVGQTVRQVVSEATDKGTVPVFAAYNLPFRDCGQYSAGGALDTASYLAWIDAVAANIGTAKAVIILEPDGLGIIPYNTDINGSAEWCKPDLTRAGLTPGQANAARYTQLNGAVDRLEQQPNVSVYLDATHPAWLGVGDIADRLVKAGVQRAQGFFLNASNYQFATNSVFYGTWISDCIATGNYGGCPNQYWNGGPDGTMIASLLGAWTGVALSPYGEWSDTATNPALNTSGYAARFAGANPTTHFVIDTSRNGQGPNNMSAYSAAPFNQPGAVITGLASGNWCNNPAAGTGVRPTASTGVALVDAYLWVKTVGESDGTCDTQGGARAWDFSAYNPWNVAPADQPTFDPLWGMVDPAAGRWFSQMALSLANNANPALPGGKSTPSR